MHVCVRVSACVRMFARICVCLCALPRERDATAQGAADALSYLQQGLMGTRHTGLIYHTGPLALPVTAATPPPIAAVTAHLGPMMESAAAL